METPPKDAPAVAEQKTRYIWIELKLNRADWKNVQRILEGKFEVTGDTWLVVRVKV